MVPARGQVSIAFFAPDALTGRNPCERVKFSGADFAGQGVYARAERGQSQHCD
jgi:hypothetical protein